MGVKGLWRILKPAARILKLPSLAGKRVAIDASIWIVQLLSTRRRKGNVKSYISGLYLRLGKLLAFGLKPVIVFDGEAPKLKAETRAKRSEARGKREEKYRQILMELLAAKMCQEDSSSHKLPTLIREESPDLSFSSSDSESDSELEERQVQMEHASADFRTFSQFQVRKYREELINRKRGRDDEDLEEGNVWKKARKGEEGNTGVIRPLSPERVQALRRLGIFESGFEETQNKDSDPKKEIQIENHSEYMREEEKRESSDSSSSSETESRYLEDSSEPAISNEMVWQEPVSESTIAKTDLAVYLDAPVLPSSDLPSAIPQSPPLPPTAQIPETIPNPLNTESLTSPGPIPDSISISTRIQTLETALLLQPLPDDFSKLEITEEIKQLLRLLGIPWYKL